MMLALIASLIIFCVKWHFRITIYFLKLNDLTWLSWVRRGFLKTALKILFNRIVVIHCLETQIPVWIFSTSTGAIKYSKIWMPSVFKVSKILKIIKYSGNFKYTSNYAKIFVHFTIPMFVTSVAVYKNTCSVEICFITSYFGINLLVKEDNIGIRLMYFGA